MGLGSMMKKVWPLGSHSNYLWVSWYHWGRLCVSESQSQWRWESTQVSESV